PPLGAELELVPPCRVTEVLEQLVGVLNRRLRRVSLGPETQTQVVDADIREVLVLVRNSVELHEAGVVAPEVVHHMPRDRPPVREHNLPLVLGPRACELGQRQVEVDVRGTVAVEQETAAKLMLP